MQTVLIEHGGSSADIVWLLIVVIVVVLFAAWLIASSHSESPGAHAHASAGVATEMAPAPPRAKTPASLPPAAKAPAAPDDLKRIEGIGPKLSSVLQAAGIATFSAVAAKTGAELQAALDAADVARISDPTTWPEQAALAAAGKWDELSALQDVLKGGRKVT